MAQGDNLKGARIEGSGRKPGGKNHKTVMMEELMMNSEWAAKIEDGTFITPAVFWAGIINDPSQDNGLRHECAKAMAPYFYKKQPQVTEVKLQEEETNISGFTMSIIRKENT